jgi:hypothetical protein
MQKIDIDKGIKLLIRPDGFRIFNFKSIDQVKLLRNFKSFKTLSVSISGVFDFRILEKLDNLEMIIFLDADIEYFSIEQCSRMNSTKEIQLINSKLSNSINFGVFENLEELETEWLSDIKFNCPNLRSLVLRKAKSPSLEFLSNLKKLEALELLQGGLPSLEGIEKIISLKALTLYSMNKIESILPISNLLNLEYLDIRNFKGAIDIEILKPLANLKWLVLENCYDIKNIDRLNDLKSLIGVKILGKTHVEGSIKEIHSNFPNGRYGYFIDNSIHDTLLEFYRKNPIDY